MIEDKYLLGDVFHLRLALCLSVGLISRLLELQKILLRMSSNLNDGSCLDQGRDFLPAFTVKLETLDEV